MANLVGVVWAPYIYVNGNIEEFNVSPVRVLDENIELGKVETTGKPVSIDEVICHIEEALND